jgi:hypothetical protein
MRPAPRALEIRREDANRPTTAPGSSRGSVEGPARLLAARLYALFARHTHTHPHIPRARRGLGRAVGLAPQALPTPATTMLRRGKI